MTPDRIMRTCTLTLAVILGISGAFNAYASFYDARFAYYALVSLVPCALLIWLVPTDRPSPRKGRPSARLD